MNDDNASEPSYAEVKGKAGGAQTGLRAVYKAYILIAHSSPSLVKGLYARLHRTKLHRIMSTGIVLLRLRTCFAQCTCAVYHASCTLNHFVHGYSTIQGG